MGAADFAKRERPLEDVSELLVTSSLTGDFCLPLDELKAETAALTDIFTVVTTNTQLQPLYFSRTVADALHLEKQELDKKQRLEIVKKLAKTTGQIDWARQWKELLGDLYRKDFNALPDVIKKNLAPKIEVTAFCDILWKNR